MTLKPERADWLGLRDEVETLGLKLLDTDPGTAAICFALGSDIDEFYGLQGAETPAMVPPFWFTIHPFEPRSPVARLGHDAAGAERHSGGKGLDAC